MQREFLESILANLQSGIIVVGLDFSVIMVNSYVAEFSGRTAEEFVGKHLGDISPQLFEKVKTGRHADELAVSFFGYKTSIGFNLSDLLDTKGQRTCYIIHFRVISATVRNRSELRQQERLAAMCEIVGRVAHEIRNPLFAMTAAAQILEMELPLEAGHKALMASLLRESRRLNGLLDVLRESTAEIRLHKKRVDLSVVVDESLQELAALGAEKGVSFKKASKGELWLAADGGKIKRVIVNLLRNAVEFSSVGGAVSVDLLAGKEDVTVIVTDRGKGIRPESLEKLFDLFYTTEKGRSGLGLFVASRIVAAHDGRLTAGNLPEGGARFVMVLPYGEESV